MQTRRCLCAGTKWQVGCKWITASLGQTFPDLDTCYSVNKTNLSKNSKRLDISDRDWVSSREAKVARRRCRCTLTNNPGRRYSSRAKVSPLVTQNIHTLAQDADPDPTRGKRTDERVRSRRRCACALSILYMFLPRHSRKDAFFCICI
jgi:hypothetical protein